MVPEKRNGSWGMMARRVRRSWSLTLEMSTPSIVMVPERVWRKRKRASEKVDLPAFCEFTSVNRLQGERV